MYNSAQKSLKIHISTDLKCNNIMKKLDSDVEGLLHGILGGECEPL